MGKRTAEIIAATVFTASSIASIYSFGETRASEDKLHANPHFKAASFMKRTYLELEYPIYQLIWQPAFHINPITNDVFPESNPMPHRAILELNAVASELKGYGATDPGNRLEGVASTLPDIETAPTVHGRSDYNDTFTQARRAIVQVRAELNQLRAKESEQIPDDLSTNPKLWLAALLVSGLSAIGSGRYLLNHLIPSRNP